MKTLFKKHLVLLLIVTNILFSCSKDDGITNPSDADNGAPEFITKWKTTTDNEAITIKINPDITGYNYTVNWGDGSTDNSQTTDATHTYNTAGTHTVEITGDFPALQSYEFGDPIEDFNNAAKLVSIENWGDIEWKTMEQAFRGCVNMEYNATDIPNLSNVTSLSTMFFQCNAFNGNLNNWDISTIINMQFMFEKARLFNGDISNWDVSKVTHMNNMFKDAEVFNSDITNWDVSKVINMEEMFANTASFNSDITNWDVGEVINMGGMFANAAKFNQDIGDWDVSKITDMQRTFFNADAFNQDISDWEVSAVTNMSRMFEGNNGFNQDISGWDVDAVIFYLDFAKSSVLPVQSRPIFPF